MSRRTASPRTPRSARVSAGISWARSVARNERDAGVAASAPRRGRRSRTARRSRRGRGARGGRAWPPAWVACAQPAAPVGAVPEHPQHLLDGAAVGERGAGAGEQPGQPGGAAGRLAVEALQRRRVEHRPADQLAGRGGPVAGAHRAGEGAYVGRVEPAERRGQQRLDPVGADVVVVVRVVDLRVDDHARARPAAAAPRARAPAGCRRRPPRPGRRRRPGPAAGTGSRRGRSAPAPPSRTSRCRPRGGPGGAGRRCSRSRRGRCRR